MTRAALQKFYQTPAWRKAARACRARAGWMCERCKSEGLTVAAALAHHKIPLDEGGPKFEGLEALCRMHHEIEHNRQPNAQQREWGKYLAELRQTI